MKTTMEGELFDKLKKESKKKKKRHYEMNVIAIVNSLLTILPEDNHLHFQVLLKLDGQVDCQLNRLLVGETEKDNDSYRHCH